MLLLATKADSKLRQIKYYAILSMVDFICFTVLSFQSFNLMNDMREKAALPIYVAPDKKCSAENWASRKGYSYTSLNNSLWLGRPFLGLNSAYPAAGKGHVFFLESRKNAK